MDQERKSRRAERIRPYQPSDLEWIMPIAEKYGERDEVAAALGGTYIMANVIPPWALAAVWEDEHGAVAAFLADRVGIRELVTLAREVAAWAKRESVPVRCHADHEWGVRIAKGLGLVEHPDQGFCTLEVR